MQVKDRDSQETSQEWCTRSLAAVVLYTWGETRRALENLIKDHRAATRWGENYGEVSHSRAWLVSTPSYLWEETSMLDQTSNNTTLLFKEVYTTYLGVRTDQQR